MRRGADVDPQNPMETAWRLYAHPRRLAAALGKAWAVLRAGGTRHLWSSVRRKLRQPQFPVALLVQEPAQEPATLEYEDRWVLVGGMASREHSVSIVIPTKGNGPRLTACLESIRKSTLPDAQIEVIVVNNGNSLGRLPQLPSKLKVLEERRPFNWAAYNNRAVRASSGEYLLFLNDDVTALHGGWLDAMLAEFTGPTGAVGAKLLYPSGRIQHVGIMLSAGPEGGHPFKFQPRDFPGLNGELLVPRKVDAVTGACLMTPRVAFESLNGFDERFSENYNDVDYCLRLQERGQTIVVTPTAELLHAESSTRPLRVLPKERQFFRERWLNRPDAGGHHG